MIQNKLRVSGHIEWHCPGQCKSDSSENMRPDLTQQQGAVWEMIQSTMTKQIMECTRNNISKIAPVCARTNERTRN